MEKSTKKGVMLTPLNRELNLLSEVPFNDLKFNLYNY